MSKNCNADINEKLKVCCRLLPARYVFAIMAFFGTFHVYLLRVNLSVAIVAMVDYEGLERQATERSNKSETSSLATSMTEIKTNDSDEMNIVWNGCGGNATKLTSKYSPAGSGSNGVKMFLWDANMQGLALGSYFYGYICSQIIGVWLGRRLGLVKLWGFCMMIVSTLTILIPASVELGFAGLVVIRVIIGLFSGVSYPILHGLMSMWAPPSERGKMLVMQFAGSPVGSAVAFPLCAYLSSTCGWQSAFYVTGSSGLVWTVLLVILVRDAPAQHSRISDSEKEYIEKELQQNISENSAQNQLTRIVPWQSLLLSSRVWSTVVPHFSNNFATYIFSTMLPTYLRTVMNIDLTSSGTISSIPYISKILLYPFVGIITDYSLTKGISPITVRKTCTSLTTFVPGVALVAAAYSGCHLPLLIFLFSVPDALDTLSAPGYKTAMIEMAPAFAGIIFGIANTIANASGFLAPQIAGALREHFDDQIRGWNILFWIGAIAYFAGGFTFLIFGTSDIQDLAKAENHIEMIGDMKEKIQEGETREKTGPNQLA